MSIDFCDLMCRHAERPREEGLDGSGSCRTFVALYCTLRKSFVHKNLPCSQKAFRAVDETPQTPQNP
jgi:hypothetical protein